MLVVGNIVAASPCNHFVARSLTRGMTPMTQGCIAARGNSCRGSSVVVGMAESMVVVAGGLVVAVVGAGVKVVVVAVTGEMVVVVASWLLRLDDALTLNELKQWPPDLHALSLFLLHDDGMYDGMDGCTLELLRNLC